MNHSFGRWNFRSGSVKKLIHSEWLVDLFDGPEMVFIESLFFRHYSKRCSRRCRPWEIVILGRVTPVYFFIRSEGFLILKTTSSQWVMSVPWIRLMGLFSCFGSDETKVVIVTKVSHVSTRVTQRPLPTYLNPHNYAMFSETGEPSVWSKDSMRVL